MKVSNCSREFNFSPIRKIEETDKTFEVISLLEKRLPKSCNVYNAAKMQSRFPSQTSIYILGEEIDESTWVIITHFTENYGMTILISADEATTKLSKSEAIEIFSLSNVINWKEAYCFVALEKWISEIIVEVSVNIKGNSVKVEPDTLFYMNPQDYTSNDLNLVNSPLDVKRLDETQGVEFMTRTWKYAAKAKNETAQVVQRLIKNNETGAVYLDSKLVSAVLVQGFGLLSMLHTPEEHRGKGYAKLCMKFACNDLVKNKMVPASSVEMYNEASLLFHKKLGFKEVSLVNWIVYTPPTEE